MEKTRFFVDFGQIHDINGDEPWLKSELHCLCNPSSKRTVMLTLGAKRKAEQETKKFLAGDLVTVANHSNLFQFAVFIV